MKPSTQQALVLDRELEEREQQIARAARIADNVHDQSRRRHEASAEAQALVREGRELGAELRRLEEIERTDSAAIAGRRRTDNLMVDRRLREGKPPARTFSLASPSSKPVDAELERIILRRLGDGDKADKRRKATPRPMLVRGRGGDALALREERADDDDGLVLSGHAAVFGVWSEIQSAFEGNFLERLNPSGGVFSKTIGERRDQIRVLLNHGHDELGDRPLGSIRKLEEDERGLYYEVDLFRGLPEIVLEGLRAGEYGASFRFEVIREELVSDPGRSAHNPKGLPERTLKEVKLHEFGPTPFGAYDEATAMIRGETVSLTDRWQPSASTVERTANRPATAELKPAAAGWSLP